LDVRGVPLRDLSSNAQIALASMSALVVGYVMSLLMIAFDLLSIPTDILWIVAPFTTLIIAVSSFAMVLVWFSNRTGLYTSVLVSILSIIQEIVGTMELVSGTIPPPWFFPIGAGWLFSLLLLVSAVAAVSSDKSF
jgi:hypothetical protein